MSVPALLSAPRRLVRCDPALLDAVLASLLLVASLTALMLLHRDHERMVAVACCVLGAGTVALRRRMPLPAAAAALLALVGYELATHDPNGAVPPLAVVLTFYTVGRARDAHRYWIRVVLLSGWAFAGCVLMAVELHDSPAKAVGSWLLVALPPLALGLVLARRGVLTQQLAAAAAQLRAERNLHVAQAATEERNRVARDLHDIVAHCVSVMVVQAGAARLVAAHNPADADRALAVIGECGRDALADLRRIVGVLHRDADPNLGGGTGRAGLERLAERIHAAGVPTHLRLERDLALPPAIAVVAYHVAREALTNIVKHAGAGATASVQVTVAGPEITVEVTNTAGAGPRRLTDSGHGLIGMRERVGRYGGELTSGATADGGWAVRARLPLKATLPGGDDAPDLPAGRAPQAWQSLPSWAGDAAIAAGWLVALELEAALSSARQGPWALSAAAVSLMAAASIWRRRSPLLFLVLVGGLAVALGGGLTALDRSTLTGFYSLAVPLFTVSAWQPRGKAILGLVVWVAGAVASGALHHEGIGGAAGAIGAAIVVWAAGRIWRAQRILTTDLTETTQQLTAERDRRAKLAIATERTRIARELHGPVARSVVTMVVQAEAARSLLTPEPARAEAAIRAIEQTGREALTQLRHILGVLRSTAAPAQVAA